MRIVQRHVTSTPLILIGCRPSELGGIVRSSFDATCPVKRYARDNLTQTGRNATAGRCRCRYRWRSVVYTRLAPPDPTRRNYRVASRRELGAMDLRANQQCHRES